MENPDLNSKYLDNHQNLQQLLEHAIISTKAITPQGIIVYANKAELSSIGYEKEEYIGRSFSDFFEEENKYDSISSILKTGKDLNNEEVLIRCKNGDLQNLLISSMSKVDANNTEYHYIFSRDITGFKRTQELLGYLNMAGEELASAHDTDTAINKISNLIVPRFANWFTIDLLEGNSIIALKVKHADPDQIKWAEEYRKNNPPDITDGSTGLVAVLTTGQPLMIPVITDEMLKAGIDDPERLEMFRSMNLRSAIIVPMLVNEKIRGAVTFISTILNRKYDETDLQFAKDFANRVGLTLENVRLYENANKEIAQRIEAERRKDEFLSIASHELKTPLTSIKAYIQLLQKTIDPETKPYNFILKTNEHIGRLERLISDLLDVSKIEAGKMGYNPEDFNFNDLLLESVESAQYTTDTHTISIDKNVNITISADKLRIEQVLNNFLSNAIKYSLGQNKIIVRSEVEQNNLIVSVQDFGIGIERDNIGNLFDRFYRVDNTSMKFQGLGLGLFISAEILKRHNGSFWIESEPQKGSRFFFLLPLKKTESEIEETDGVSYYRNSHIKIKFNKIKKYLEAEWTGFQNLETVQHGCMMMHKILKLNNCEKVLNDNTEVQGNWSEAVDWGGEVWFPMMENAGTKYFAWIYSPSTFSQLSAEKSINIMQGNILTQLFNDRQEAVEWLEKVY